MHKIACVLGVFGLVLTGCVGHTQLPDPVRISGAIPADAGSMTIHVLPLQLCEISRAQQIFR
jgi:hypothetical protein